MEAFAEKFRAALSRREVAIRDFYDLDYAVRRLGLCPQDPILIDLVRQKLAMPGNDPADVSPTRLAMLRQQLEPQLKPVLRSKDFAEFDLERAIRIVMEMASASAIALATLSRSEISSGGVQGLQEEHREVLEHTRALHEEYENPC